MKHIVAVTVVGSALFTFTSSIQAAEIKDLKPTHSAYKTVSTYVDNGFVALKNGYLHPNEPLTRGEMAQILFNTMRLKNDATITLAAKDVSSTHPHYNALRKIIELGIMDNSEVVRPNETLTRAQATKIIALAFQIEVDDENKTSFTDYSSKFWAKQYIESLADIDIVKGKTKASFAPSADVTRMQFILLVSRAKSFTSKVNNLECAYDFLSKHYVETKRMNASAIAEVITIVNKERSIRGLNPVEEDKKLTQLAFVKVNDILQRKYFEHKSPFYGYPWEMANYFDYEFRSLGENLAKNLVTPTSVMKGWMASPKHKENILKPNYTHIGLAVKRDQDGNYFWVQMFSSK